MKHSVSHDLGQERAKQAAEAAIKSYGQKFAKYNPQTRWVNPNRADISFTVKGISLSGAIEVQEKTIDLDMDVPFLLRPFKNQALSVIEAEIREWIDKARAGQL
ncbi:MAG TPA: polyhydroxyalkanoic acid system family protein [Polyangiaceae bacterium]|nr:polyhydroxyalkanoic acid system family protein [Polyangiaceae bacterium]